MTLGLRIARFRPVSRPGDRRNGGAAGQHTGDTMNADRTVLTDGMWARTGDMLPGRKPDPGGTAERILSEQAFRATLEEAASQVAAGTACGVAVALVIAVLEHGLEHQRGEITRDEMYRRIRRDVAKSAAVAAAVSGIVTSVALAFPALIPLATPLLTVLAAVAICLVGGKVYRLGRGWYELHWRIGVPLRAERFPQWKRFPGTPDLTA